MTLLFLLLGLSIQTKSLSQNIESDTITEQLHVEMAVTNWANDTFIKHENYLFKGFTVQFTDDYTIQAMRIELYEEKISILTSDKEGGTYPGTDENFQTELRALEGSIQKVKNILATIERVDHYEIQFWSNIQCMDGITVYYELLMKIDSNFTILEAVENSSIGKRVEGSKIAYQKKENQIRVIEK